MLESKTNKENRREMPTISFVDAAKRITGEDLEPISVTAARQMGDQLHDDRLTGVLNRTGFEKHLNHYMEEYPQSSYALVYIDLDKFKQVNDTFGHATGDDVLKAVSAGLQGAFQRSHEIVGRLGGDEFIVALPFDAFNSTDSSDERRRETEEGFLKEYLRQTLADVKAGLVARFGEDDPVAGIDFSFGLTLTNTADSQGLSLEEIIEKSGIDGKMYEDKRAGKSGNELADPREDGLAEELVGELSGSREDYGRGA